MSELRPTITTARRIVKRLFELETELFGLYGKLQLSALFEVYRKLRRLRLDLQAQWRVLPSGGDGTP